MKESQQEIWREQLKEVEVSFRFFDDWEIFGTSPKKYAEKKADLKKMKK